MKSLLIIVLIGFLLPVNKGSSQNTIDEIIVNKIYSDGDYNAFTSLLKFKRKFYCSFRSGENHVYGRDGVVKIISSKNGKKWKKLATISAKGFDLRDAKLSVTPNGRILVNMGGSMYKGKKLKAGIPHISISNKRGTKFSTPQPINLDSNIITNYDWLWSLSWYNSIGYGGVYKMNQNPNVGDTTSINLVKTANAIDYTPITELKIEGRPSETTIVVMADGEMLMMIRRDQEDKKAYLGKSNAPYTHWKYLKMPFSVGGPDFIALDENHFIGGGRIDGKYTSLFTFTRDGDFKIVLKLPSNSDSSYPGFVIDNNKLFVSYYSSHETKKASIYFAEIPLSYFRLKE